MDNFLKTLLSGAANAFTGGIAGLGSSIVDGVSGYFQRSQEIRMAKHKMKVSLIQNRQRLAESQQTHNHEWEMKQLENVGYKDDILFYAWIGFFVYSGVFPEKAMVVFNGWNTMPAWFMEVSFWIIASVLGVKKIGENLPGMIAGIRGAIVKPQGENLYTQAVDIEKSVGELSSLLDGLEDEEE